MNAVATYEKMESALESITNTNPQSLANMEVGDEWRQGDCRIIRLPDDFGERFASELEKTRAVTQLAPGTTRGSRHCLSSRKGMSFYRLKRATVLDGPVIHATKSFSIPHPEHGDCVDLPPGWYSFPGQRVYAEELRRVAD